MEHACQGQIGERSFSVAGTKLWNLLPKEIRMEEDTEEFKKKLKTFLFEKLAIRAADFKGDELFYFIYVLTFGPQLSMLLVT